MNQPQENLRSKCCNALVYSEHGCDDDLGHAGKECNCEMYTSWWVCEKCQQVCDPGIEEVVEEVPSNVIPFLRSFTHISPLDLEEILEWLQDMHYLSDTGIEFRKAVWEMFIKE